MQVWRVEKKSNKYEYAMKEMSKVKVYEKNSVTSIVNERKMLAHLRHP
jgi:serine/threonine protein kinase